MDTTDAGPVGARPSGIEVALAMARVRLAETHFQQVMAFIEFTAGDLSTPRALDIYARLHHLSDVEYATIRNRVLAAYGENGSGASPATFIADHAAEWNGATPVFRRIRRRLGGRRNLRLRKRVELFSGRVEAALLDIHVDCVCRMTKHLDPSTSVADVVALYMEALHVRRSAYLTIYATALARLYAELQAAEAAARARAPGLDNSAATIEPVRPAATSALAETEPQAAFDVTPGMPDLDVPAGADRGRLRVLPGRAF